ncbi:Kinesin-like protein KIN-14U [Linum perenne]
MLISGEKEEQPFSASSPMKSDHGIDDLKATVFTDVNVVPEHESNDLDKSILNLEGEIAELRQKQESLDKRRRAALNRILDIKGSIRVFCRVRPFLLTERRRVHEPISVDLNKVVVRSVGSRKEFRFDKVLHQSANQDDVFVEVEPVLKSALDGHNACILAYGQTGTGKTFTMDGLNDQPGIIPRALEVLFREAMFDKSTSLTFSMSMLEVYMGGLKDLLAPKASARCNLNIQTDPKGMVDIEGLTEVQLPNIAKAKWWYSKGRRCRSTSCTNVNETSSRSHCLMKIMISRDVENKHGTREVSKLWMVDLGGSERLLKTGATGLTLDEGRAINLSLSALGDVIAALRRKRGHVPYRHVPSCSFIFLFWLRRAFEFFMASILYLIPDYSLFLVCRNSKLTQILKDSLGHSSKVLMLVHISPCEEDVGETTCSLSFSSRARGIETDREVAEDVSRQRDKRIMELEEEMREAEEECQKLRNQIRKAEFLVHEYRKPLSSTCQLSEDKENISSAVLEENKKETNNTITKSTERGVKRNIVTSLPRFMTSTAASRHRQTAAEREVAAAVGRARSLRSEARSSTQFSCSQSLSYSEFRLKAILRDSNKKSRYSETKTVLTESPKAKCNSSDSKVASSTPRSKLVTSSDPNFRSTIANHRRRMSDLT